MTEVSRAMNPVDVVVPAQPPETMAAGSRQLMKTASQIHRDEKVVYVSNLVYALQGTSLEDAFYDEGLEVAHVELLKKGTGSATTGCGLAVVTMHSMADKQKALQAMNGKLLFGRPMAVLADKFV
eukprot:CAMPEP_0117662434 /NCGR_PEP_ID=MMETSP0804-20121206/8051_1 /TAXON_ID=1074897 /ORGANISM="Tetraselmis astigmatica, Strain CCMP880" /LENGTH=124 /DNA_ID=CAMNT_0005469333 /DNA_START=221 /DNA_END=595 /DNA_ORIENTATION=+